MIKVNAPLEVRQSMRTQKASRTKTSFNAEPTDQARPIAASNQVGGLDAILSLQGDGGSNAKTRAAIDGILEELESLQRELLNGDVSEESLTRIVRAANQRAHAGADGPLQALFDEVALRAKVELAKMGRQ